MADLAPMSFDEFCKREIGPGLVYLSPRKRAQLLREYNRRVIADQVKLAAYQKEQK